MNVKGSDTERALRRARIVTIAACVLVILALALTTRDCAGSLAHLW